MIDQIVMVSPRLGLIHTRHTPEDWVRSLTAMHHNDPDVIATLVTWWKPHHRPEVFAAPDMLMNRAAALRQQARARRQPTHMNEHRRNNIHVNVRGPLGPHFGQLLTTMVHQTQMALGRPLSRGKGEHESLPNQFWDLRDVQGAWTGSFLLRLLDLGDASATFLFWEGTTLQVGRAFATTTARRPLLTADPFLLHPGPGNGRRGGR